MTTYLIAELGQNHNGSLALARAMIDVCALPVLDYWNARELPGIDAVKLCKRDLRHEGTRAYMDAPYSGPQSFGDTYGAHRRALELSVEDHAELAEYARSKGLQFVDTVCAPDIVDPIVDKCRPDRLKVASRDLTNGPLLEALAATGVPLILSTGMAGARELDAALAVVTRHHEKLTIMHCVSQYPADYTHLNVRTIAWLRRRYPYPIGYSDHSVGLMAPILAVALGAEVIEKHITLSRRMKGTDHPPALDPEGVWRLARDVRNAEASLGQAAFYRDPVTDTARLKLARSISTGDTWIRTGELIDGNNTCLLSPGDGYGWLERGQVYGRRASRDIPPQTTLRPEDVTLRTARGST